MDPFTTKDAVGHLRPGAARGTMSQPVVRLAGDAVPAVIESADVPVMIDFGTAWCTPCRRQQPVTRQVALQVGRAARIYAVDIDGNRSLAVHLNIHSIPTLIVFFAAVERERFIGVQSPEILLAALNRWAGGAGRHRILPVDGRQE